MEIKCNVLDRQYKLFEEEYKKAAIEVLDSGWYILGTKVQKFETEFAEYTNSHYCVGLNSGLDALIFALKALNIGEGDEVIVPANTYIATVLGITQNGATPIFVEPDEFYNINPELIEAAITDKTKAVMCVHLYGQSCRMDRITEICKKHNLYLFEDCAQSHGAYFNNQITGSFGDVGCFSFYPTKNLGAFGDAGAIVTSDSVISETMKMLRNYGSKVKYYNEIEGINSRLDEMQAALLSVKLSHMKELTDERIVLGNRYYSGITNTAIIKPETAPLADHVYHQFVIRTKSRDLFQKYLADKGIQTQIHYPVPPHLADCYRHLGYKKGDFPITEQYANEVLSLPLYTGMTFEEQDYVIQTINNYRE